MPTEQLEASFPRHNALLTATAVYLDMLKRSNASDVLIKEWIDKMKELVKESGCKVSCKLELQSAFCLEKGAIHLFTEIELNSIQYL